MHAKLKHYVIDLTPPVVLRLRFIECMLGHYGNFNRHLLCDYFGISTPQASADINQYKALAPDNMYYSQVTRQYVAMPAFKPLWPTEEE